MRGSVLSLLVGIVVVCLQSSGAQEFVLTEFLASSYEGQPWVEIHREGEQSASLAGWSLSVDPQHAERVSLPAEVIEGQTYRAFFVGNAAGQIDFNLNDDGGYLSLIDPGGVVASEYQDYPKQREDVSYGPDVEGEIRYFLKPTFEQPNQTGVIGFVADTKFSTDGGFYDESFELEITSATPDSVIRYTTDGSEPSIFNGNMRTYAGPIEIGRTTVIRAQASKSDYQKTNLDTQTYLFTQTTLNQPEFPDGLPENWGDGPGINGQLRRNSDYAMDSRIRDASYIDMDGERFGLAEALRDLPSMALVMDASVLWDPETGIHALARNKGREWERKVSVEYFDREGQRVEQANGGIRMQGGWNRNPEMLKKSLRLYFRKEYGAAKFHAPLFPDTPVQSFDTLILRSGNGKAWPSPWRALTGPGNSLERTTYLRDEFVRVSHRDMGQPIAHGDFVHLYINGHYWGLYNLTERLDEHFGATYFEGDAEDQDVIKWIRSLGRLANAGTEEVWEEVLTLARDGIMSSEVYAQIEAMVDLENLMDYMLVNFYVGNGDWPDNNAYTIRPRVEGGRFRFLCWDSEESLVGTTANRLGVNHTGNMAELYSRLLRNDEFQVLQRDRIYKHLFNDGALTNERSTERMMALARRIDRAIVAESARWGDLIRPAQPYTRDHWETELVNLRENYLGKDGRRKTLLDQLKASNQWETNEPPQVLKSKEGDQVSVTIQRRSIFAPGMVYYTLDDSDPRLSGGEISDKAMLGPVTELLEATTTIKTRAFLGARWTPMVEETVVVGVPASSANLRVSEVMYHPNGDEANEFIELHNFSSEGINLRGMRFLAGIDYDVGTEDVLLVRGERVLLVRNASFPTERRVIGSFANETRLSNGGETITLVDAMDQIIQSFTYDDRLPWPDVADGEGRSLVLQEDGRWGASAQVGGSPGRAEVEPDPFEVAILQTMPRVDAASATFRFHDVAGFRIDVEQSMDLETWRVVDPVLVRPGAQAGIQEMFFSRDVRAAYLRLRLSVE